MSKLTALAIVAHPDDIEFTMAGTLLLLKDGGADIHFWNLANGCYGSMVHSQADITRIRAEEARAAAKLAGATIHPSITDDLNIFHTPELIAKVTSTVRAVKPQIILTHSPQDYMEDHMNAARLAVTGAFIRAAPNYVSDPSVESWDGDTVIYHACRTDSAGRSANASAPNSMSTSERRSLAKENSSPSTGASRNGSKRRKAWDPW